MIPVIIVIVIIAIVLYKLKENKEFKEYKQNKDKEYAEACAARKKDGEPSICEALPPSLSIVKETVIGPDGKE